MRDILCVKTDLIDKMDGDFGLKIPSGQNGWSNLGSDFPLINQFIFWHYLIKRKRALLGRNLLGIH